MESFTITITNAERLLLVKLVNKREHEYQNQSTNVGLQALETLYSVQNKLKK